MQNGNDRDSRFNPCKNELVEQEGIILNMISFELDNFPIYQDIIMVFMAQGILYTSDRLPFQSYGEAV